MSLLWLFYNELIINYLISFSVLISNMVNTDSYKPQKQRLFEVFANFLKYKGILRQKSLGTSTLKHPLYIIK